MAFVCDNICDGGIKLVFSYNLDTISDRIWNLGEKKKNENLGTKKVINPKK